MVTNAGIKVINPGFLSTIQDMGRSRFQAFGVPEAGGMDKESVMIANLLVDKDENSPVIEITVMGLELEVIGNFEISIAITGGNLSPKVDNLPAPMYKTITVSPGSRIKFSSLKEGARAYLAFSGEMKIPKIMDSFSTYLRGDIGGMKGRKLVKGDIIEFTTQKCRIKSLDFLLVRDYKNKDIRVILNRDEDYFTGEGINTFLTSQYLISPQSDRMGYRLEGPEISHRRGADIISTAINLGGIQIPGHGKPIVMMADRQTVGGYTQMGRVISNDLPYLAQMLPGAEVRFSEVSLREAQDVYRRRMKEIRRALV